MTKWHSAKESPDLYEWIVAEWYDGYNRQFMVWYSKVKGLTEKVIELYPRMSLREIAEITGFVKTTIIRCVAKNHLRHTEEIKKESDEYVRQRRSSGRKSYDYSKLSKKITHTIEIKKMIILSLQYHQKQTLEALMM